MKHKLIMENWRRFLVTEAWAGDKGFGSLMAPTIFPDVGQPGDALRIVESGGELKGWDKYGQLVAEAYLAAPDENPEGLAAFNALVPHIDKNFQRMIGIPRIPSLIPLTSRKTLWPVAHYQDENN